MNAMNHFKPVCFLLLLLGLVASSGCSFYGSRAFDEFNHVKVDLESKNFVVRKIGIQGNASTSYLFGIPAGMSVSGIALGEKRLHTRAWKDMSSQYDGNGSYFYHNICEEWSSNGIPLIFIKHKLRITSDVYEFDGEYIDYAARDSN